ncbi:MAG: hypothetical protein AAF705_21705 [Bacteroidota bacterium]
MKADLEKVKQRINEDYFNLWNKSSSNPFVATDMPKVYLSTEALEIIDPDFSMNDASLSARQAGFDTIYPLLTAPWNFISEGGITEISHIRLDFLGNGILASLQAKGLLNFKNGSSHQIDRNATQIWKYHNDNWYIAYEHVS